jgi:hypothetical protein
VGVPRAAQLTWWSACLKLVKLVSGGTGALLLSLFTVEWGMLCAGWGCGGVGVLPLLSGFSCKVHLQCLSKILI